MAKAASPAVSRLTPHASTTNEATPVTPANHVAAATESRCYGARRLVVSQGSRGREAHPVELPPLLNAAEPSHTAAPMFGVLARMPPGPPGWCGDNQGPPRTFSGRVDACAIKGTNGA